MNAVIAILREVRDPRDANARHDCAAMLFASLVATLCGAKTSVEIADFCAANRADLSEFVDFPHGAPSHDSFSRLFRLLDPDELKRRWHGFAAALREGLGLGPVKGVVAVDGKRLALRLRAWARVFAAVDDQRLGSETRLSVTPAPARTATKSKQCWRRSKA